eukprot:SAG31_NODE_2720_length_5190_cov_3.678256_5_plen_211_part_00
MSASAQGLARGSKVDGAADNSHQLLESVQKIYTDATMQAKLQKLEEENAALKAKIKAAEKAMAAAGGDAQKMGGVSASGAAGLSGTMASGDEDHNPNGTPPPKVGPDVPGYMVDTVHLCTADRWGNLVSIIPSVGQPHFRGTFLFWSVFINPILSPVMRQGGGIGGSPMIEDLVITDTVVCSAWWFLSLQIIWVVSASCRVLRRPLAVKC